MTLEEFTEKVRQDMHRSMSEPNESIDRYLETDEAKFALKDAYKAGKGIEEKQEKRVQSCSYCLYMMYE